MGKITQIIATDKVGDSRIAINEALKSVDLASAEVGATILLGANGGTGVANSGKTITIGGNFTHTGAHTLGVTTTANTSVTLPTTGTVITADSTSTITNKTFDANGTGNSLSNVDVADLSNGTDGELITWDAAGAPAVVATGNTGQTLTSNGVGAAPTFNGGGVVGTSTEASSATPTINTDNVAFHDITALAVAITSMTTNLSGTERNGQKLTIRFKDNGTGRAITWGASFEAVGVSLPTTTTATKRLTVGFVYDTTTSKFGCVASVEEA